MLTIQCKMARAVIGWEVRDVAREARVSPDTITHLERSKELKASTREAIRSAPKAVGVEFIPENNNGVGVKLRNNQSANEQ